MNIAIIASSQDPAGVNIRNNLIELFDFEKVNERFGNNDIFQCDEIKNINIRLYLANNDLIFSENIDRSIGADILVFASKHRSRENMPSFTVHPIGNWHKADFGGREKTLCLSSATLLKNLFIEMNNNSKNSDFVITLEATHHGPCTERPSIFIEIGSTEKEWNGKENGKIIAKTIIDSLKNQNNKYKIAFGIGGRHYCTNFNKIMLRTDIAVSHICPKHMLENLDEELIQEAIRKTAEKVDFILLDWKGLGTEKQRIVEILKKLNVEFRRTEQVLK